MQNLRTLREQAHLTQTRLAELAEAALPELPPVEIQPWYISDLESGRNKKPNALAVLRIAAVLECDPKDLYIRPADLPAVAAHAA